MSFRRHKLLLISAACAVALLFMMVWVTAELAEALTPFFEGVVDRIDHVIEYERTQP